MEEKDIPFLGSGWSFPPHFLKEEGRVVLTTGEEDIRKSLEILLSTSLGERIMRPDYGCNLGELMFETLTTTLTTQITEMIKTAILYHESRIKVEKVELMQDNNALGKVEIVVDYIIKTTNSRSNFVYPFYIKEASTTQ